MFNRNLEEMEILDGPVQFSHQYMDMPNYKLNVTDPNTGETKSVK